MNRVSVSHRVTSFSTSSNRKAVKIIPNDSSDTDSSSEVRPIFPFQAEDTNSEDENCIVSKVLPSPLPLNGNNKTNNRYEGQDTDSSLPDLAEKNSTQKDDVV